MCDCLKEGWEQWPIKRYVQSLQYHLDVTFANIDLTSAVLILAQISSLQANLHTPFASDLICAARVCMTLFGCCRVRNWDPGGRPDWTDSPHGCFLDVCGTLVHANHWCAGLF